MKFAYADPPYFNQGQKLYNAPEWDLEENYDQFIKWLSRAYPAGWALSASSVSLRTLLPMCPVDVRIAAWVKPFAIFKPNVNPAYAREPVIFRGGRRGDRTRATVRDWHSEVITLKKGLTGAKPKTVCEWIIDLLGALPEDQLDDLFPGTGIFGETWNEKTSTSRHAV